MALLSQTGKVAPIGVCPHVNAGGLLRTTSAFSGNLGSGDAHVKVTGNITQNCYI